MTAPASPYLTPAEAAAYVRLSLSHFKALQAQRKTPACRIGRKVLYRADRLEAWIERGTRNTL